MCGSEVFAVPERARQVRAGAAPVPSPCVSVCRMGADSGLCEGCWRTLDEIRQWSGLDDAGKRVVWARIEQRLSEAVPAQATNP